MTTFLILYLEAEVSAAILAAADLKLMMPV